MKKLLISGVLLFSFLGFSGQCFAAPATQFIWLGSEHRSFDQNFYSGEQDRYYTMAYWELIGIDTATINRSEIYIENNRPGSPYTRTIPEEAGSSAINGYRSFYVEMGYTNFSSEYIPSEWVGTYDFTIETSEGNLVDSRTLASGDAQIMGIPTTTVSGNVVSWNPVADVTNYRIRLIDPNDHSWLYDSDNIISGTSFDLTGEIENGTYILRMEARKFNASGTMARGVYYSEVTVTPVPGTLLLFATGLLGIARLRRKS